MFEIHHHLHLPDGLVQWLSSDRHLLTEIRDTLKRMEAKLATVEDLNNATASVSGVLTANDARVAGLAGAISDAASASAARDTAFTAQITALQAQIAAGNITPEQLQPAVDKLAGMATEAQAEGAALDAATTALAAAFPPPSAPAAPAA